jgi:Ca-activated chloride channel homolog
MTFLWPRALLLYLFVPAFASAYLWIVRRPSRTAVRYPNVASVARAAAAGRPWRRHVPAVLYVCTLCGMLFALARPVVPIPVPDNRAAVMLSIDVSGSMAAHDVYPSRIEAAKTAAAEFVRTLPRGAKVGLVTFSTYATLVVPPTEEHDRVIGALKALRPQEATAIGDGILEAVYALPGRYRLGPTASKKDPRSAVVETGDPPPASIVLMSDGESNTGTAPEDAARTARLLRVKVYTVGLGTPAAADPDDGGAAGDFPFDEETLKRIAGITGGTYHGASSAAELTEAYTGLGRSIGWPRRPVEVSGVASGLSAAMLAVTLGVAVFWYRLN